MTNPRWLWWRLTGEFGFTPDTLVTRADLNTQVGHNLPERVRTRAPEWWAFTDLDFCPPPAEDHWIPAWTKIRAQEFSEWLKKNGYTGNPNH